jgi:hypothetical protein
LYREQRRGVRIIHGKRCVVCGVALKNSREDDVVFMCGHTYHVSCLRQVAQISDDVKDLRDLKSRLRCVLCHQQDAEKKVKKTAREKEKERQDRLN